MNNKTVCTCTSKHTTCSEARTGRAASLLVAGALHKSRQIRLDEEQAAQPHLLRYAFVDSLRAVSPWTTLAVAVKYCISLHAQFTDEYGKLL